MTKHRLPRYLTGSLAFGIYFIVLGLLIYYFNTKTKEESKRFVAKNEDRIEVALTTPKEARKSESKKEKVKQEPVKKETIKKPTPEKKVIKEKIVKKEAPKPKQEEIKRVPPKKVNQPKSLFDKVDATKPKIETKPTEKPKETLPKNDLKTTDRPKDKGVENAYLAKVTSLLEGWPAQSEFAGETVKVKLWIEPSGKFEYKITAASNNPNFNESLEAYLKQLQLFGLGKHDAGRTYEFDVEFLAKE